MKFFDRLLGQLLPEKKEADQGVKEILLREMITRTERFKSEYQQWLDNDMHEGILADLRDKRERREEDSLAQVNYYTHRSRNSNGFYFRAEAPWNSNDYSFLVQLFIDRVKELDYHVHNSVREAVEEVGNLKTIEEFYLKPSLKHKFELPYNRLYGNVFFEHKMNGDKTELVKVLVNSYSDQNFKPAYDFEDFMDKILVP